MPTFTHIYSYIHKLNSIHTHIKSYLLTSNKNIHIYSLIHAYIHTYTSKKIYKQIKTYFLPNFETEYVCP